MSENQPTTRRVNGGMRTRDLFQYVLSAIVFLLLFMFDPDSELMVKMGWGATTIASLLIILKSVFGIVLIHVSRKTLFDYIDLEDIYVKVMNDENSSVGAGLFMIGVGLFAIACASIIQKAF